jgi:hypothetical protein
MILWELGVIESANYGNSEALLPAGYRVSRCGKGPWGVHCDLTAAFLTQRARPRHTPAGMTSNTLTALRWWWRPSPGVGAGCCRMY